MTREERAQAPTPWALIWVSLGTGAIAMAAGAWCLIELVQGVV